MPLTGAPGFTSYDAGNPAYGAYNTQTETPTVYGSYLDRQYGATAGANNLDQFMGRVGGRTQWDFQREGVQQQFSDEQARQLEQLDAYLAS